MSWTVCCFYISSSFPKFSVQIERRGAIPIFAQISGLMQSLAVTCSWCCFQVLYPQTNLQMTAFRLENDYPALPLREGGLLYIAIIGFHVWNLWGVVFLSSSSAMELLSTKRTCNMKCPQLECIWNFKRGFKWNGHNLLSSVQVQKYIFSTGPQEKSWTSAIVRVVRTYLI